MVRKTVYKTYTFANKRTSELAVITAFSRRYAERIMLDFTGWQTRDVERAN